MSDHKITRLVSSQGTHRTLELDDGSVVERSGGTVSWRNNNPGNLKFEFAGSADTTVTNPRTREQALTAAQGRYQGVVGLDQWGNAVFESYEAGRAAKIQLLERSHGKHTVEQLLPSYSRADYSGQTNHTAQAAAIFAEGDRQGVDLRGKTVGEMGQREREALADGIRRFEGWREGETRAVSAPTATLPTPQVAQQAAGHVPAGNAAIYNEANQHFFKEGRSYEYGRPDISRAGRDPSRLERDLDGDGRLGVDCSAFVWRGLKNAGYDVQGNNAANFTTSTLFNGSRTTPYAREHFDVVSAADARRPGGNLQQGDILMFSGAGGQHVGIFKGYDEQGKIQFVGSQSSTGPAEVTVKPGGYWDGGGTTIVGALRAKPEFQVRAPEHGNPSSSRSEPHTGGTTQSAAHAETQQHAKLLRHGDRSEEVRGLQQQLNQLGVRDGHGKPLGTDGRYGDNTRDAVMSLQKEHGLKEDGVVGPQTRKALQEQLQQREQPAPQSQTQRGPSLDDPAHANYNLHQAIKTQQPSLSNDAAAHVTAQAVRAGIDSPDKLRGVTMQDNTAHVLGTVPGFRASVDLNQPVPPAQESASQLLAARNAETQQQDQQRQVAVGGR
jgi:hypothetical protein